MKKKTARLVLHRETLLRLDVHKLRSAEGGNQRFDIIRGVTQENNCTSPLCGPTTCLCEETQ